MIAKLDKNVVKHHIVSISGWEGCGKTHAIKSLTPDIYVIPELARLQSSLDPKKNIFSASITEYVLSQYVLALQIALLNGHSTIVSDRNIADVVAFISAFDEKKLNSYKCNFFLKNVCRLLERDYIYDEIIYINAIQDKEKITEIISDKNRIFSSNIENYFSNLNAWEKHFFNFIEEHAMVCKNFTIINNYGTYDVDGHLAKVFEDV